MKRETIIWTVIFVLGGLFLLYRTVISDTGMATSYTRAVTVQSDAAPGESWVKYDQASPRSYAEAQAADPNQTVVQYSFMRTFGVWIGAFFTLAVFSFVYKDNPFYKFAEAVFIGVSAAYWMVVGFWTVIVPNLFGKLTPVLVRDWFLPGLKGDQLEPEMVYLIPLALGVMLLWRLMPVAGWVSRWPLAFFIGVFCGLRLVRFIHADFLSQIKASIIPIVAFDDGGSFSFWGSLRAVLIVGCMLCCLVYFFFSFEHKGAVGKTARVGTWVLMITFGAAFGYTVMGRIALLAIRIEFLLDDWLWLIDPTGHRVAELAGLLLTTGMM